MGKIGAVPDSGFNANVAALERDKLIVKRCNRMFPLDDVVVISFVNLVGINQSDLGSRLEGVTTGSKSTSGIFGSAFFLRSTGCITRADLAIALVEGDMFCG